VDGPGEWVDKDAFVLPLIPEELGVEPQFAALLHAAAFLELSGDGAVDPDWAVEALEHIAHYLLRLPGPEVERLGAQLAKLATFGQTNGWSEDVVEFIQSFFEACGVVEAPE
jgi:hypothetical protein